MRIYGILLLLKLCQSAKIESGKKNLVKPDFRFFCVFINESCSFLHLLGVPFTSLVSDNGKFKLVIENQDEFLMGHLVLYQVLDDYKDENNVQLWHSDYASKGSKALITVKYKKTL